MAELSLAVVGLAAQLFTSIKATYTFLRTAKDLNSEAPVILWKLRIQEIRFWTWGRMWGFDEGKLDEILEAEGLLDDVVAVLQQIHSLLGDAEKLQSRYGIARSQTEAILEDERKLGWKTKFRWAMSDKMKFEELITHLKDFNDGLHGLLRLRDNAFLNCAVQSEVLRAANNVEDVRFLQDACAADQRDTTTDKPTVKRRPLQDAVYDQLQLCAQTKELQLQLETEILPPPLGIGIASHVQSPNYKPRSLIKFFPETSASDVRIFGSFCPEQNSDPEMVLIEWKDHDVNNPWSMLISRRVEALVRLLSNQTPKLPDFRILECAFYFNDTYLPRFGFAYRLPPSVAVIPPTTLADLLSRTAGSIPELGERFALAQALSISIMRLHDCSWLHGAIRPSNIVFFHRTIASKKPSLREPYLMGFMYSLPADPSESTLEYSQSSLENDLYRHPSVGCYFQRDKPRAKYEAKHDCFSLGVILLEIGLWQRVSELWKVHYTPEKFLQKLLDAYVPKLGPKMGAIYREVVRLLLTMEVDKMDRKEEGDECGNMRRSEGYWRIVRQLEICKA